MNTRRTPMVANMPNNNCNKGGRAVTKFVMLSMSFVVSKEYPASFE